MLSSSSPELSVLGVGFEVPFDRVTYMPAKLLLSWAPNESEPLVSSVSVLLRTVTVATPLASVLLLVDSNELTSLSCQVSSPPPPEVSEPPAFSPRLSPWYCPKHRPSSAARGC